jgi:hypothetical protein
MRRAITAGGLAFCLAGSPLAAQQDRVSFSAEDAHQCAVWSSYLSSQMTDDPETAEALLFVTNYFVGYYEGRTGRAIAEADDIAAMIEVEGDLAKVTDKCATLMVGYGERMTAWGEDKEAGAEEQ